MPRLGIRGRSLAVVALVSLAIAGISLGSLYIVGGNIAQQLGFSVVERYVSGHKARVEGFMQRELALARQMANSTTLRHWARNEEEPTARKAALEELEFFRNLFASDTYFVALAKSGHYYFKDPDTEQDSPEIVQTLNRDDPKDSWFYDTLSRDRPYHLNVDFNRELRETKVWFNVLMGGSQDPVGVAGTGLDISDFVQQFVQTEEDGLEAMLINRHGAIQAHEDVGRIALNTQVKGAAKDRKSLWGSLEKGQRASVEQHMERLRATDRRLVTLPLTLDGRPRLAALAYLPELEWYSLATLDPQAVLGWPEFLAVGGVFVIALALALALLTLLFNRFLLLPILNLAGAARQMARGDYAVELADQRQDELGMVARTFNQMAATVKEYTQALEDRVRERTQDLEVSNHQLERTNGMLLESITSARRIQEALLPSEDGLARAPLAHFALWLPRDQVGGDLYIIRPAGDGWLVGVMDCTGHGVPGAVTAMAAHSAFNHAVDRDGRQRPAAILQGLNQELQPMLNPDRDAGRGTDNGLEMALCRWDPGSELMGFASTRLSLYRIGDNGAQEWEGDHTGIGYRAVDPGLRFTEHSVPVAPGDTFYLASDGFMDQSGGPKGLPFGHQHFRELLTRHGDEPLAAQRQALETTLADWQGEQSQRDDITVVGFRLHHSR